MSKTFRQRVCELMKLEDMPEAATDDYILNVLYVDLCRLNLNKPCHRICVQLGPRLFVSPAEAARMMNARDDLIAELKVIVDRARAKIKELQTAIGESKFEFLKLKQEYEELLKEGQELARRGQELENIVLGAE